MKRFIAFLMLVLLVVCLLTLPVWAEGSAIGDTITKVIDKGDEVLGGYTWWEAISNWVRGNLGAVVSFFGGVMAVFGVIYTVLKSNPKVWNWLNSFGLQIKGWFDRLIGDMADIKARTVAMKDESVRFMEDMRRMQGVMQEMLDAMKAKGDEQVASILLLAESLEDVVKLSGASEEKKDIYITKIEEAKRQIGGFDEKGEKI